MSWGIILLLSGAYITTLARRRDIPQPSRRQLPETEADNAQGATLIKVKVKLQEVSTLHKIIRIVIVLALTILGIVAAILFFRNVLNYQRAKQLYEQRLRVMPPHTRESSPVQSSVVTTDVTINEQEGGERGLESVASNSGASERGKDWEKSSEKATDFPTLMTSRSRSSAGCDNDDSYVLSPTFKRRPAWDDIEMMRHGGIRRDCMRVSFPERFTLSVIGNKYDNEKVDEKNDSKKTEQISWIGLPDSSGNIRLPDPETVNDAATSSSASQLSIKVPMNRSK